MTRIDGLMDANEEFYKQTGKTLSLYSACCSRSGERDTHYRPLWIVALAGVGPGDRVVEIGPGLGSLTLGLLEAGAEVTAVEIDERVLPALEEVTGGRARIVAGDALQVDWRDLAGPGAMVVANLPYNVATPLVLRLLDEVPAIDRLLVMVQREVGERMAAAPGRFADSFCRRPDSPGSRGQATPRGACPNEFLHPPRGRSSLPHADGPFAPRGAAWHPEIEKRQGAGDLRPGGGP